MKRGFVLVPAILLMVLAAWIVCRLLLASQPAQVDTGATPAVGQAPSPPPRSGSERIILLHTNDFHGAVEPVTSGGRESGGLVNLMTLIDTLQAEHPDRTLILDAGDSFQGTYVSNSTQGEVVLAAMNLAGYNAWTLGNHEFDWGQEALRTRIAQARFPVLAANLVDSGTGQLWDAVRPYVLLEAGRARVAVVGLSYPDTPVISKPENVAGLAFQGAVETMRRIFPELEVQADLIVVLSHLGYDGDQALARAFDGLDVVVGGHSHLYLERPQQVNGAILVQAGAKGQVLGRLEITVDLATGQVTEFSQRDVLVPVRDGAGTVNPEVQALVDAALAQAAETMDQPIGETARRLEPKRSGEFALGNLVVDAMLAADLSVESGRRPGDGSRPEIAFHNNGGIRAALPKGAVTYGQLYEVLPFDNQLMALDLTGAQVLRILEHSVADGTARLQVSGLAFRYNSARPAGQRIVEVTVGGQPLDPARTYRVVTIDYLAAGGDGQETFLEGTHPTYGDSEVWVVAEYIGAHSPVAPQVEGRIRGQ